MLAVDIQQCWVLGRLTVTAFHSHETAVHFWWKAQLMRCCMLKGEAWSVTLQAGGTQLKDCLQPSMAQVLFRQASYASSQIKQWVACACHFCQAHI